jgi:hypothetical protein
VRLLRTTLQQFDPDRAKFDVLLLHNSVNHLDESACMALGDDDNAWQTYLAIFEKLRDLAAPGATLILADCSRHNFFGLVGMRNPFARSIEWQKHQPPEIWIRLLERCGFANPRLSWTTFNSLGSLGRVALGNRLAAYFLMSHFRLSMRAVGPSGLIDGR